MKLRFYYGTRAKLSIEDTDNFSRSDYKCRILLQTKRGPLWQSPSIRTPASGKLLMASALWCSAPRRRHWPTAGAGSWI